MYVSGQDWKTVSLGLLQVANGTLTCHISKNASDSGIIKMDREKQTEIEAAAFRRLISHLQSRTDVQNIDLMNLAGFCRNCLSRWYGEAAADKGIEFSKSAAREAVYGMPYEEWKERYQTEASAEQIDKFQSSNPHQD